MARSNNNNKLKAFVRFDGSGRIVPSSLIVQAFKPKVGNYKEIDAKECCNPTRVVITDTIPHAFPLTYVSVRLFCDASPVQSEYTSEGATNMSELITLLNTNPDLSVFGTYVALNATTVQLTVSYSIQNNLCPDGVLSFNIFED